MKIRDLAYVVLLVISLQTVFGMLVFVFGEIGFGVGSFSMLAGLLTVIAVSSSIAVLLYWIVDRYSTERAIRTAMMAMSEDEELVLKKIMQHGEVRQDNLRRELNFSKSKLSALVRNLVDKQATVKTPHGRTNLLKPTEKFRR